MGRLKSFMLLESGDKIVWERAGQTFEGVIECLHPDTHSITGEAYIVSRMDGEVLKEYTVYPSEVCLNEIIKIKKTSDRLDTLIRGEDLND